MASAAGINGQVWAIKPCVRSYGGSQNYQPQERLRLKKSYPVLALDRHHRSIVVLENSSVHWGARNQPIGVSESFRRERRGREGTRAKTMSFGAPTEYDRAREVKEFDDSKIGVQGLVESGVSTIPRFFIHPPENLTALKASPTDLSIPTIDLSGVNSYRRSEIVRQITEASRTWGFFQVINHGIPSSVLDETISAVKSFNEQPVEVRKQYYVRGGGGGVAYNTNFDLFQSKAASWRDTLQIRIAPEPLDWKKVPEICRKEVVTWNEHVTRLGEVLMGVLSEGLGLDKGRLQELTCLEGSAFVAHYYPRCPQPDLTLGIGSHTDPGVLTVLLQNHIGGLQVKHGEDWVEVKPLAGAIVINVGDLLQVGNTDNRIDWADLRDVITQDPLLNASHTVKRPIFQWLTQLIDRMDFENRFMQKIISNDEYKSVEHRAVANPFHEPRVSIAIFFNPAKRGDNDYYGPLPELVSHDKPAVYRNFTMAEFLRIFFTRELGGLLNFFKLQ